jgi:hypothetical protein
MFLLKKVSIEKANDCASNGVVPLYVPGVAKGIQ